MTPASRLIISDMLLPTTNAAPLESLLDIQMIVSGGMERTEKQWRELLEGEGLRIERIVKPEVGAQLPECLIECMMPEKEEESKEEPKEVPVPEVQEKEVSEAPEEKEKEKEEEEPKEVPEVPEKEESGEQPSVL